MASSSSGLTFMPSSPPHLLPEVDGSVPSTPSNSTLEDGMSMKESSEHSCSSSVIDDEGCPRRGPTVVARLMGLDSMPAASSSGPYPTPFAGQHTFQAIAHDELIGRSYVGLSSPHKMPSSPIDRFRMEALPPRFAKRTSSVAQHKLFSPVKNPNHVSSRNAADIMEAASRIIGPGAENTSSYRVRDAGYSNDVRAFSPTEIVRVQQMSQAARRRDSAASSKPPSGRSLDGSLITLETSSSARFSQSNGSAPVAPRVKAVSRPSSDFRATNGQGREGVSRISRKPPTRTDPVHNMVERNGSSQQRQKISSRVGMASSSNVLVQNNTKQNAMGVEHKMNPKSATHSQQQRNLHPPNAAPRKAGVTSRSENSMRGNRKGELQPTNYANRRPNSTAKTIPKPRRLPDEGMRSKKNQPSDKVLTERSPRRVRHNIVIEEQSSFTTNKKKISTEIVSFTFTSPVDKSLHGSQFPHSVEKRSIENWNSVSTSSNTSNTESDTIDGDYLRLLLEQKLRELTSGVRSPYSKPVNGVRIYAPSPGLDDTASACDTSSIASTGYDRDSIQSSKDGKDKFPWTDLVSKDDQSSQSVKYDNDSIDQVELEHLHLSPHCTWETSLSTETCSSADSRTNANESRLFSSTEGAATSGSTHYGRVLEVEALSEYSDTASSITTTLAETIHSSESSSSCRMEIKSLREILNAISVRDHACSYFERFDSSDILDPHLFEELNGNFRLPVGEEERKSFGMIRRLLFDCVNEVLSVKCAYYFSAGYSSWFTGMAVLQKLSPEEIYQEMTSLKVAEEWMVDVLVYKEMSGPLGSWVDFKTESHEAAKDITAELLESLVDEMVADLLYW
ncbi:hypothetical protein ZWY2020_018932 [Hordeum vulgare]|nr:hypothetical protein ZWY2020_018932 [Hordeum vulgare]